MSTLGSRIKEFRRKRGFTQNQMAEKLNMTEANFSSYERNKSIPPSEKLNQISSILDVSTDYLLGRTDDPMTSMVKETDIPYWATKKDVRDFKRMLEDDGEIMFDGVPIEGEARQRVMDVLTGLFWEAKEMNKKTYGRKKDTKKSTSDDNNDQR